MTVKRNGWPPALRTLILKGITAARIEAPLDPMDPFELLIASKEEYRKITLLSVGCPLLVLTYTGPDSDRDYNLKIKDNEGREVLSLYVNLNNVPAKQTAYEAIRDILIIRLRSSLSSPGDTVWSEFEEREEPFTRLE